MYRGHGIIFQNMMGMTVLEPYVVRLTKVVFGFLAAELVRQSPHSAIQALTVESCSMKLVS